MITTGGDSADGDYGDGNDNGADGDKEEENGGDDDDHCVLTALTPAWRSRDIPIWR